MDSSAILLFLKAVSHGLKVYLINRFSLKELYNQVTSVGLHKML
jgi:hypothetical protein